MTTLTDTQIQITGRVIDASEHAIAGADVFPLLLVQGEDGFKAELVEKPLQTDAAGRFTFGIPRAIEGSIVVSCTARALPDLVGVASAVVDAQRPEAELTIMLRPRGQHAGSHALGRSAVIEVGDAVIDFSAGPTAAPPGAATSTDLTGIIDSEFKRLLGSSFDPNDATAANTFTESLERAFSPSVDQAGNVEYAWTPSLPASVTQPDGTFGGVQAVLVSRARDGLNDAIRQINAFKPIKPDVDENEAAAVQLILVTLLNELVQQFSTVPPNVERVNGIFEMLKQQFETLGTLFGFQPENVELTGKDAQFTTFLMVLDYVSGLFGTWETLSAQLKPARLPLGTRLALLSRALARVSEAVQEVYRRMDAYMLGPSVRQTLPIPFPEGQPEMLISELFGWAADWSAAEAPRLVNGAGVLGIGAIRPTAQTLHALVGSAIDAPVNHQGYHRPQVRRAIADLAQALDQVVRLTQPAQKADDGLGESYSDTKATGSSAAGGRAGPKSRGRGRPNTTTPLRDPMS